MRVSRLALWALAAAFALTGCAAGLPNGATVQAGYLHRIWTIFFWAGVFVYVTTAGLIVFAFIAFRKRPRNQGPPKPVHNNYPLEITWTILPIILVGGLFWATYPTEYTVEHISTPPRLIVNVTGFRWGWRFDYPADGIAVVGSPENPSQLVLPVNVPVRFNVYSVDVDHSFWIPAFLFKRDAIPGRQNHFELTPRQVGVFRGECGEFCGLDHALMTFSVRVVTDPQYRAWLATARRLAPTNGGEPR